MSPSQEKVGEEVVAGSSKAAGTRRVAGSRSEDRIAAETVAAATKPLRERAQSARTRLSKVSAAGLEVLV